MYVIEHQPCVRNLGTPGMHTVEVLQTARPLLYRRLRVIPLIHNIKVHTFHCPNHSSRVLG
jgi:hypothetical protein